MNRGSREQSVKFDNISRLETKQFSTAKTAGAGAGIYALIGVVATIAIKLAVD